MFKHVLDASVVLAFLRDETGGELAFSLLSEGVISTVNLTEVLNKSMGVSLPKKDLVKSLLRTGLSIISFDHEQAHIASDLNQSTRSLGLSLGDTACLALGIQRTLPVYSADRIWQKLNLPIEVRLIR